MKKILISLLILAFLVPVLVFSAENEGAVPMLTSTISSSGSALEKILSPDQIKFFKVMKKEGNTLYGIRIEAKEKIQASVENASEVSAMKVKEATNRLEKIAGPWDVKMFEKIKQVGNALWGYRKQETEHLGVNKLTPEIITCLKTAIDKKDEAIKKTVVVASDELVAAIDGRNTCQKAALDLSTNPEIIKAFKICKENFEKAVKESRNQAKRYRDEAWKVYKQEMKTCHALNQANDVDSVESSEEGNVLMEDGGDLLDL